MLLLDYLNDFCIETLVLNDLPGKMSKEKFPPTSVIVAALLSGITIQVQEPASCKTAIMHWNFIWLNIRASATFKYPE